jgi:hypothetical protein
MDSQNDVLNNPRRGDLETTGREEARAENSQSRGAVTEPDRTPPRPLDLSSWLPKATVAAILECSTKWVERFERDGKLQRGDWKNPATGRPMAVYHPGDVERLRAARKPDGAAFVVSPLPAPVAPWNAGAARSSRGHSQKQDGAFLVNRAAVELAGLLSANSQKVLSLKEKLFLTLVEASEYSGLPKAVLLAEIKAGLPARRTGAGWRFKRSDLEKLS